MDVKQVAVDNWPYLVGGVVGVYILYRVSRGSGGASAPASVVVGGASPGDVAAGYAAQIQRDKVLGENAVAFVGAQGLSALQAAKGAADVIGALQGPTVAAINAAAADNIATVQSSAAAAIASYGAQANITGATAGASGAMAAALAAQSQALSQAIVSSNAAIVGQQQALRPVVGNPEGGTDTAGIISAAAPIVMGLMSDETVKKNIEPVAVDSLEQISRLRFVSFDYDAEKVGDLASFKVGLISQEAKAINSAWVQNVNGIEYLVVPQMLMSAFHAIAQLQAKIKELEFNHGT